MKNNQSIQEKTFNLLEATNLNWSVSKEELVSKDGKSTETFGIFRNDSNAWLGSVGNRYVPMQNWELAETIVGATEGIGLETTRGGELDGGKKVYLQAELPSMYIGKSSIMRWITALNSNDGSASIGFGSTSQVVVCKNTFHRAYKDLDKFRHTESAKSRIETAMADLRKALHLDEVLMGNFKKMADIGLKDEMVERVIRKLFTIDVTTNKKDVSSRKLNQVTAFADALQTEINLEGKTIWGLFNAVTRYTNHVSAPKNENDKLHYLVSGGGYKMNNLAFDEVMKFVTENTVDNKIFTFA